MPRLLAAAVPGVVALSVAFSACERSEAACKVDTDCPQGNICREEACGPVSPDAGTPPPDAAIPPPCSSEGTLCGAPDDCCSHTCTDGRCASSAPPTATTCRGLSELCRDDCCAGLSCVSGICR